MCKEMPIILVNRVLDRKRIVGGPCRRRGVAEPKKKTVDFLN
jgi:hypothetical protein